MDRKFKAFTLVEIMIVVAIIVILTSLAVPGLMVSRVTANEGAAKTTLKAIATACESYYACNFEYPSDMSDLTEANPSYINEDYTAGERQGYNFTCDFTPSGYSCNATPVSCNVSGSEVFTITTGALVENTGC